MADKRSFDLTSILGDVSKLDTVATSGAVISLPAEQIHANDKNFYDVSNVDTLADAILLDGLQSPLVVNQRGEGDYVIISGHRRFKALQQIIAGDARIPEGKLFAADINAGRIPCFVNHYSSDLEAELALIRANSDTRVLTSAEISKQAERVEMLLYGLKEQGYSFPGKMRDYVAECCKVSASKLARLKVIREKLIAPYLKEFDSGKAGSINESVAYELAQLSEDDQHWIFNAGRALGVGSSKRMAEEIKALKSVKCKNGPCTQPRIRWDYNNSRAGQYKYMPCTYHPTCCKDCSGVKDCSAACPQVAELQKDAIAAEKAKKKAENAKIRAEQDAHKETCRKFWGRLQVAMTAAGINEKSEKKVCDAAGLYYYKGRLTPPDKMGESTFPIGRSGMEELSGLADVLGCSTDFLLCKTDIREPPDKLAKKVNTVIKNEAPAPDWRTDMDYTPGWCAAQVQMSEKGEPVMQLLYRSSYCWRFARTSAPIEDIDIVAWYPVPERREAHDGQA